MPGFPPVGHSVETSAVQEATTDASIPSKHVHMHLNRCYPPPLDALHSPHSHSQACSLCGIGSVTNQAYSHFPLQYLPRPCRDSTICEVVAQHFHLWASIEVEFPLDHIGPFSPRDLRANIKFVVRQTHIHASCLIHCAWCPHYLCFFLGCCCFLQPSRCTKMPGCIEARFSLGSGAFGRFVAQPSSRR